MQKFSYSQLQTYDRCEFAWYLSHVEKWEPAVKKDFLAIGTMFQEMLTLHYRGGLSIVEYTKGILSTGDPRIMGEDVQNVLTAGNLVEQYINHYADTHWVILETEYYFDIPLITPAGREVILEGYADMLVEIEGKLWLVETKTCGNAQFWSDLEILMDPQTPTYAAALRQLGLDVFGILFNFANTYVYKRGNDDMEKVFKRVNSYRTQKELDSMVLHTGKLIDRACDDLAAVASGGYVPRKSLRRDCKNCWYNEPCLFDIKGIPMEGALEGAYVKREKRPHGA